MCHVPWHICEVRTVERWGSPAASWFFFPSHPLSFTMHVFIQRTNPSNTYCCPMTEMMKEILQAPSLCPAYVKSSTEEIGKKTERSRMDRWPGTVHILPVTKFGTLSQFFCSSVLSTTGECGSYIEALGSCLSVSLTSSKLKIPGDMSPFHVFSPLNPHSFLCFSLFQISCGMVYGFYG